MANDYETLRYETDGHVTVLTYDRPEQRNAVSRKMNTELHHAWQRFRDAKDEFARGSGAGAMASLAQKARARGRTGTSSRHRSSTRRASAATRARSTSSSP